MKNLIILICAVLLLTSCGKDKIQKTTYFVAIDTGPYATIDGTPVYNVTATDQTIKSNLTRTQWLTYEFENGKTVNVTAKLTQGNVTLYMQIFKGAEADPKNIVFNGYGDKEVTGWFFVK
jgi:major membrane immunogen (membrane-anchored lipoprotein)